MRRCASLHFTYLLVNHLFCLSDYLVSLFKNSFFLQLEGLLALLKLLLDLCLLLDNRFKSLHAPVMQLEPQHLFQSRVLVYEHIVESLPWLLSITLLIHVVLHVCFISLCLEGVAAYRLISTVENDAFVDGLARHGVFHSANNLERVIVELLWWGNCRVAEAVLEVVLEKERISHLVEVERVLVVQVQLHCLLYWWKGWLMIHCNRNACEFRVFNEIEVYY